MTHSVLARLLNLQREQIAIMKAFGFANRQIAVHYLKFALVMVTGGTVLGFQAWLEIVNGVVMVGFALLTRRAAFVDYARRHSTTGLLARFQR